MSKLLKSKRQFFVFSMMAILIGWSQPAFSQIEGDAANGKKLFKANCASCHKLDKKLVGPALAGVTDRREVEWLVKWIKNNAELRASGDADAIAIYEEYNGSPMTAFPQLSDQDVMDILAYTIKGDEKKVPVDTAGGETTAVPQQDNSPVVVIGLGVFFLLLIGLLVKVRNTLKEVKGEGATNLLQDASSFTRWLVNNKMIMTLGTVVVGVWFLSALYAYLMSVGVEQDYQPVQPIAFSHELHAGQNEIDCNYCHSSARHSKTSGIPSANVCMNCHMYVDGSEIIDPATGTEKYGGERSPEIQKIYAAIGWDADERKYIEDYETQPIKWVRIHNLPDLAYFNHAQHVTAGQVQCQTCHGPVETMEEVYQYSPLTMGWCINCHRETKVKVETNGYYEEMHEKLKAKYHGEDITVEKIGGLECGKCHY